MGLKGIRVVGENGHVADGLRRGHVILKQDG